MSFYVSIKPGSSIIEVKDNRTILESAKESKISLPHSCNNGKCSKCKCRVISGSFEMKDYCDRALNCLEKNKGYILSCKTYPLSDMVIQYDNLPGDKIIRTAGRVFSLDKLLPDIKVLRVKFSSGIDFQFKPGQYFDFITKCNKKRSYSIANSPSRDLFLEFHIRHFPGGVFTDYLFGVKDIFLDVGDILNMEEPFGSFTFQNKYNKPVIFLSTGTGFAPIKSMMEEIIYTNNFSNKIYLYCGGKNMSDIYMYDLAKKWEVYNYNFKFIPVISSLSSNNTLLYRHGNIHDVVMQDFKDLSSFQVYACGSSAMVDRARVEFISKCKLPAYEFYSDAFISIIDSNK